ncbi:unnamed protein product [Mytilus coruscus]|uniref:Reverse transcriptase domain-containing protein n=1 Tax=Mytilus coruscus TaxID=42192 RepID=A0A6J8CAS4_MYTCO|nr:unnamed protein product [Mytilus coruscus]
MQSRSCTSQNTRTSENHRRGYNDPALFYSLIKKQRGKLSRFIEELTVDEEIFQSPVNVMKGWNKYFGDLAKKSNNNSFDTKYQNLIEKEATHIIKMCKDKYIHQEITTEEIKKAVSKLNTNKAEDFYGLTAEHFIHGIYIALLDGKSAFDVVVHANLIRRMFQIDFTEQSILLLNNLYEKASSLIKWNNLMSKQMFTIDQGVRQGGAFSADLYKICINPLLNILSTSGFCGRVENNCCAPTCADDVALTSNNPLELQTIIDISLDFSKREGYLLQPTKSVVIPVKICRKFLEIEDGFWKLNGKNMSIVPNASHIGIQKSDKNSDDTIVNENIKKARRAMYSLMGTGLHGENGLDTDSAVYTLSGLLPIEAEIHVKAINLFGNISRAKCDSIEWRLAERQLQIKPQNSHSWFIEVKELCLKYEITDLYVYLNNPLSKFQWKKLVKSKFHDYWTSKIIDESKGYSTLKFMDHKYNIGSVHPLAISVSANLKDINKIPVRLKIATGNYILQTHKASLSKNHISSICKLCSKADETVEHFILLCEKLEEARIPLM